MSLFPVSCVLRFPPHIRETEGFLQSIPGTFDWTFATSFQTLFLILAGGGNQPIRSIELVVPV
jgi:hypothetical protein